MDDNINTRCVQFFHPDEIAATVVKGEPCVVAILGPNDRDIVYAKLEAPDRAENDGGGCLRFYCTPGRSGLAQLHIGIYGSPVIVNNMDVAGISALIEGTILQIQSAIGTPAGQAELGIAPDTQIEIVRYESIDVVALGLRRGAPTEEEIDEPEENWTLATSTSGDTLEVSAREQGQDEGYLGYHYRIQIQDHVSPAEDDWKLTSGLSTEAVAKTLRQIRAETMDLIARRNSFAQQTA